MRVKRLKFRELNCFRKKPNPMYVQLFGIKKARLCRRDENPQPLLQRKGWGFVFFWDIPNKGGDPFVNAEINLTHPDVSSLKPRRGYKNSKTMFGNPPKHSKAWTRQLRKLWMSQRPAYSM
jgi:hypothetical protein